MMRLRMNHNHDRLTKIGFLLIVAFISFGALSAQKDSLNDYIERRIAHEMAHHIKETANKSSKKAFLYNRPLKNIGFDRTQGDIYILPYLPYYSLYFQDNDLIHVAFNADFASDAYSGANKTQDLSKLIFGECPILLKEILLASKLVNQGLVVGVAPLNTPPLAKANHFLSILADQKFCFDASLEQYTTAIDYARHFHRGDVTLGIHIPVKIRSQHLKLLNDISDENRKKLQAVANGSNLASCPCTTLSGLAGKGELQFFDLYPNLEEFLEDILCRKGMKLNKKSTMLGFSDIVAYLNFDIKSRYIERFVTGVSLLIPTADKRDTSKLWDAELGNGGFVEIAAYGSWLFEVTRIFNPYFHVKGSYSFAANVQRRVPQIRSFDGKDQNLIGRSASKVGVVFGENLFLQAGSAFSAFDSTIRGFADQAIKVKIQRGPELFLRVGNTFDAIFSYKGFLDIFYDLRAKGKDYALRRRCDDVFNLGQIGQNSYFVSHTIGGNYSYQFDAQYRARLGGYYVFAGRNTPKSFGIDVSFNAEF